jgi:uncharacterized C2H2 Zn-finger protein
MTIEKDTIFSGYTDSAHIHALDMYEMGMIKAAVGELHPLIADYIANVKPINGKNILLIDALGAGEIWGENVNGDYFARSELMREDRDAGYRSYKHHQNEANSKDPTRRYGDKIPLSVYHRPMDRVQLIAIVDGKRAGDIVRSCDEGSYPDVSMACGVAYDKCSYCGSIHKVRKDYCNHAKKELRQIKGDGRKVYLENYRPRFHDISFVMIGAEKQAKVLAKIAEAQEPMRATGYDLTSLVASMHPEFKAAQINKKFPLEDVVVEKIAKKTNGLSGLEARKHIETMKHAQAEESSMHPARLEMLAKHPIEDIVKTANILGMRIKPDEFQYIALLQNNMSKEARRLFDSRQVFDARYAEHKTVNEGSFDNKIAMVLQSELEDRSYHRGYVALRLQNGEAKGFNKEAASITSLVWPALGGMFEAVGQSIPATIGKIISAGIKDISPFVSPAARLASYGLAMHLGRELGRDNYTYEDPHLERNFLDYQYLDTDGEDKEAGLKTVGMIPAIYLYADTLDKSANMPSFLSLLSDQRVVNSSTIDRYILDKMAESRIY